MVCRRSTATQSHSLKQPQSYNFFLTPTTPYRETDCKNRTSIWDIQHFDLRFYHRLFAHRGEM